MREQNDSLEKFWKEKYQDNTPQGFIWLIHSSLLISKSVPFNLKIELK